MNFTKKLRSVGVAVASSVIALSMIAGTASAAALTSAQVSAIVSLLQSFGADSGTIANVEASLNGTAPTMTTTTTMSSGYTFTSNLSVGSTGAAVTALQQILVADGYLASGLPFGTFGQLTKAAVEKYQTANGISPVGSVGPLTRTALNSGSSVSMTPVTTGMTASAGSVSVALAATSPVNSTVVSPSATALLAQYTFTGSGQVNNIVLQRTGVSSDNTLNNVYLYNGATRLTDAASVASGVISFNNPNGLFTVNGSMTVSVRADIATGNGGETVGVSLTSVTLAGATAAVNVNVAGSTQSIANNANAAMVTIPLTNTVTASSVNAGTLNYNVWSVPFTVSTRSVYLNALTLKYIGSAPTSAFQNLALYVDGSKVGTGSINGDDFVVFDLSASPYVLTTGGHTIEVHADVVGGANYSGSFTLQNQADVMLADSQLQGVYVAVTNTSATTFSQNVAGTISINAGSIVVNQDPSFTPTTVTGGSTNVAIAQYTLADYGEAVKISSLTVQPTITNGATSSGSTGGNNSLNNVGLYVNGAQVGSLENWTGTALTFNLGSSLTVQAGQTVTLTIKADTITSGYANYTGGTIAVVLSGASNNAQGLTSNAISTIPATSVTSNSLVLGTGTVTLAKNTAYSNQSILANTPNQEIGSFVLQAGSTENVQLNNITVGLSGTLPLTSLSNLRTSEQTTPVSAPSASNSFSINDIISANTSREIDVFADVGQIPSALTAATTSFQIGGANYTVGQYASTSVGTGGATTTYGFTAPTGGATAAYVAQQLVSAINASSLVSAAITATTPAGTSTITVTAKSTGSAGNSISLITTANGGALIGGTGNLSGGGVQATTATVITSLGATGQGVTSHSTITLNSITGQTVTLTGGSLSIGNTIVATSPSTQLVVGGTTFPVAVYNAVSTVGNSTIQEMDFTTDSSSTIASVTVGGVTASPIAGAVVVSGLNIAVPQGLAGVNIPVSVTYNTVGLGGLQIDNQQSNISLTGFKSQSGNAPQVVVAAGTKNIAANPMYLVASTPTITIAGVGGFLSATQEVIDVTVSANSSGPVYVNQIPLTITLNGTGLYMANQQLQLKVDGATQSTATYSGQASTSANTATTTAIVFTSPYQIAAGTSHTFQILANLTGNITTAASVQTTLGVANTFLWTDANGNVGGTGASLPATNVVNYPTNAISEVSTN